MKPSDTLSNLGVTLSHSLSSLQQVTDRATAHRQAETIHVSNIGHVVSSAYEQLRNASENIEDHLLFQRAMLRFYKRNLSFIEQQPYEHLGNELVTELTQAGYLDNDSVSLDTVKALTACIEQHMTLYWQLTTDGGVNRELAQTWVLELMIVKSEQLFHDSLRILAFAHVAHAHFSMHLRTGDVTVEGEAATADEQVKLLYIAIHRALLKSDNANIRCALSDLYQVPMHDIAAVVAFHQQFDRLAQSKSALKLARLVNKNGAPLRIIRAAFFEKEQPVHPSQLTSIDKVASFIDVQIDEEYQQARHRMNAGVIKSVIFLLITKALIGLLIEIPYDLIVYGTIIMLPLIINLVFPPLFIAITALTFKLPTAANKRALGDYITKMLFVQQPARPVTIKPAQKASRSIVFNTVYVAMFAVAFYLVINRLIALQFNIVQGAIFFIFLSTASFLGYRLTLQVKELEIVTTSQGVVALIRDFLYAPFIFVGQRISYKFAKMNIIGQVLDMVIELPLKTILRLTRQWTAFLNNKKDELL